MGLCQSEDRISRKDSKAESRISHYKEYRKDFKYDTVCLQSNLRTIEEEASIIEHKKQSIFEYVSKNPSTDCSDNGREIKGFLTIKLFNPSRTSTLHSHALKQNRMNEVSICQNSCESHDLWEFVSQHKSALRDNDIVILRHKLTANYLCAQHLKDKNFVVGATENLGDSGGFWQIELNSPYVTENTYIKLKHLDTELYLSRTNRRAQVEEQREVALSKFDPSNSIWMIELITNCN